MSAYWSFLKTSTRFFISHPWQLWLTILSIALGSAVMIGVDIATGSAKQSFADAVDQLSGNATHYLVSRTDRGFDEALYSRLRVEWGFRQCAPVIEGKFALNGLQYQLIGIDPFAQSLLPSQQVDFLKQQNWFKLLTQTNAVLVSRETAQRFKLSNQSRLHVLVNQSAQTLTVAGIYNSPNQSAYDNLVITDIATAQALLGKQGTLDRIVLILDQQQAQQLSELIPDAVQLIPSTAHSHALEQMTAAFRTNLTAMSLLAMLVGCFLVYNSMTFSVLQRRQQFAIQRMLGMTGSQIFWQMLTEALVFALLGGLSGIVLGIGLSTGLLSLVTRTINDVYAEISTHALQVEPMLLVKGIGLTLLSVLLATLAPALEAARIAPVTVHRRSELEQRSQRLIPTLMVAGIVLIIMALMLLNVSSRQLLTGFAALFVLVVGYSLMMPFLINSLLQLLTRLLALPSIMMTMALRGISASLSRTSLAITALTIAVSATVGVAIMTTSFRDTVVKWLDLTLQNDLYISSTNADGTQVEGSLESFWLPAVQQLPGIRSISTSKTSQLTINDQSIKLLVLDPGRLKSRGFHLLKGDTDEQWQRYLRGEVALISEPYAYHQQLSVGDHFHALNNEGQLIDIEVGAIFQDYSSSQGMIVIHRSFYERVWRDRSISSIGLLFNQYIKPEQFKQQLVTLAANGNKPVRIRFNKEIRDQSLGVFDRTFEITNVLRLLVVLVAFVGVFSALMLLLLEKQRDYAVLRATGLTPRQLAQLLLMQTVLIGFLAGLLAFPLGWMLSELLIHVINQRSFGWSMNSVFSVSVFVQAMLLSVTAAVLAALYPIKQLTNMSLAQGLRDL